MDARVEWKDGMAFEAHLGGFHFTIDSDEQFGGLNRGPQPKGLTLVSLAGCTAMDVISILEKMRVKVDAFEVATDAVMEKNYPKRILEIVVKYSFKGEDVPLNKVKQAIELSLENYCGISATLRPSVKISHQIIINDQVING
ncbi:MAG: OsmC family protein [Candidatus Aminicenantes bacterium]|jgi:putative redox protein